MVSALLVIDVQNGVVDGVESADGTVAVIARAVEAARAAGCPVVWVQHADPVELPVDSREWQIVPALQPARGDVMVRKQHRSSFAGTGLADILRGRGVDRVIVTGAQSAFCVDMAGKHALAEGFHVTLLEDGHCNGRMPIPGGELSDAQVRGLVNQTWSSLRHPDLDVQVSAATDLAW